MRNFNSAEELKQVLGGFFQHVVRKGLVEDDPVVGPPARDLNDTNLVVHFAMRDPDLLIIIDCEERPIRVGFGDEIPKTPTATFYVTALDGHRFWLGDLNIPNALLRKRVVLKGPVNRLLKVLPIARRCFPIYRNYLAENGHADFQLDREKGEGE
ncbi:MAG: hypothetical protein JW838_03790 [Spirochaetes bacterium]|nr:hypothetical protein [Spirochaetota bacterium]